MNALRWVVVGALAAGFMIEMYGYGIYRAWRRRA